MVRTSNRKILAFQVGCTYIGTVVGAGFASGQEVFQFFGRFGNLGYLAIVLTTFLFAWLGYRLMMLGADLNARTYRQVIDYLFGRKLGSVMNVLILVMLFGVTVAMIAGAGELFRERVGISYQIGAIATMLVTFITILRGMDGIMRANTIIVPIMVSFVLFAAIHVFTTHAAHSAWQAGFMTSRANPLETGISALLYAALNIGLAAGVLIPLGAEIRDKKVLQDGAQLGAGGLGIMLCAVMFTLLAHYPEATRLAIPMGFVASQLGGVIQWSFVLVLWGEIYSTLVGNVFALGTQVRAKSAHHQTILFVAVLVLAYFVSQVGFTNIVKYGYTVFGWVSMLLLMALLWPRPNLPEK